MRRSWILWLLLAIFAVALVFGFPEIRRVFEQAFQGQWQWILLSALLLNGRYIVNAMMFQASYEVVGVASRPWELVPVVYASLVANLAGITASGALFVDDAARAGQSAARATAGVLLVLLADYVSFMAFLVAGLTYLGLAHVLSAYQLAGAAFLVALILILLAALLLGVRSRTQLRRFLAWLRQTVNGLAHRLGRRDLLPESWVDENAASFSEAGIAILAVPGSWAILLGLGLAFHVVELLGVFALFPAYRQPIGLGALVAGYAIGMVYWYIGITPQGIGVVEGTMTLTYISVGVPVTTAAAIGLVFRGLSFWLPLFIGFYFLPRVRSMRR